MATTTSKGVAVVGIAGAAVAIIVLASWLTWHTTNTGWRNKWLERDAAELQATIRAAEANEKQQQEWATRFADIDKKHQEQLRAINDEKDRTISSYRAGNLRLRKAFDCTAVSLPDTATAAAIRDAARGCGLSTANVEFLIRYAADAEATRRQLIEAQALLTEIYAKRR